ncbi:hypothetical protein EW146_g4354 [Bondarzewia mesenterica]|uniref:Uncharacterized protein n=1 Tax=Bondarzewia mesenterica TaxID=1095465 RepID=A0A4S4LUT8_9AGAM|nr:hypothetical protein EW146_g4354 [Bondarzewia mesenterica]
MKTCDHKMLWDEYGIVGNIMPFTSSFPRADIHQLLSPDLLHQIIKGTFKDHLVSWVGEYLDIVHGATRAASIMADIDRRIAAVPAFPELRQFPEGRGFKQWTGDDSKALMKVYLPAIAGHVPPQMVRALSAFLDFCYLVRRDVLDETTLDAIDDALDRFHNDRAIFHKAGVRPNGISLPHQHSLKHYRSMIQMFGAPNGLCSSITESKHIKAVKEPWRCSSHFAALGQMLLTNQRLDKLAASRVDFAAHHMLDGPCLPPWVHPVQLPLDSIPEDEPNNRNKAPEDDDDDGTVEGSQIMAEVTLAKTEARHYPHRLAALALAVKQPRLPELVRRFLFDQLYPDAPLSASEIPLSECPVIHGQISVFHSAVAIYYAPSDPSGIGGMHKERIRATPLWRGTAPRRDCVFAEKDADLPGM